MMVILKAFAIGASALIIASPVIMGVYFCLESWLRWRRGPHA